ncbi:Dabb family protein [Nakamurella silvestris]|nr:Dabb family protein [Nakamurella silvestris]
MIRHVVLLKARSDAAEQEIADVLASLVALASRLPGITSIGAGPSDSDEGLERGYTHGLVADFADREALRRYAVDPEHLELAGKLQGVAEGGVAGILVVDLAL